MADGVLYGLGVGPGDPELLTLKALRLLRSVPVIAYPAPDKGESFARRIVAGWIHAGQVEIALRFPMTPGLVPAGLYDRAAAKLAEALDASCNVALLCQGDPLLYGSFNYLFARLCDRFRVEIVPGVSSVSAGAAAAGAALVARDEVLTIVPATLDETALALRLEQAEAAAILKVGRHLRKLRRVLDRLGLLDRAVYVEHATLPSQRVFPLATVEPAEPPYFSMVLLRRAGRPG